MPWTAPNGTNYIFPWEDGSNVANATPLDSANLLTMQEDLQNFVVAVGNSLFEAIGAQFATLSSPNFTGTPTAPTVTAGSSGKQLVNQNALNTALANFTPSTSTSPPSNIGAPPLTGAPFVGQVVSCPGPGTWAGSPTSYAYQMQKSTDGVTYTAITGATNGYTTASGDIGDYIRCAVTATNANGSTTAYSAAVGPIGNPLTLSNMTATASGASVTVTVDTSVDILDVSLTEGGNSAAADAVPVNGVASWTINGVAAGTYTYTAVGYNAPFGEPGQSTPAVSATVTVNATTGTTVTLPALPNLPSGNMPANLSVVLADGFSVNAPAIGTTASFWGAVAKSSGFDTNEVAYFDPSQVSVGGGGLEMTATVVGTWASGPNAGLNKVESAYVGSTPQTTLGGAPGSPITGFLFLPAVGVTSVIEFVVTVPPISGGNEGMDFSLWASGPKAQSELDFPEMVDTGSAAGDSQIIWNVWNHLLGAESASEYIDSNTTWLTNGATLTLTTIIDGVTNIQAYADGAYLGTAAFPAGSWPTEPMAILLSFGYRNAGVGQNPTFTGNETVTVRSVQMWSDHPGQATLTSGVSGTLTGGYFLGGGVAQGTAVSSGATSNPPTAQIPNFSTSADWIFNSTITQSNNVLTVPVASTYAGFNTVNPYSVLNSSLSCELALASAGNGSKQVFFGLGDAETSAQNVLGWLWSGSSLKPYYTVAGTRTYGTAIPISTSVYVRIAESSGTVTWSYSANGTAWTTAQSMSDPFSATILGALYAYGSAGYYGTESASNATYSNLGA